MGRCNLQIWRSQGRKSCENRYILQQMYNFKKKTPVYLHEIKRMQTVFFSKKGGFT